MSQPIDSVTFSNDALGLMPKPPIGIGHPHPGCPIGIGHPHPPIGKPPIWPGKPSHPGHPIGKPKHPGNPGHPIGGPKHPGCPIPWPFPGGPGGPIRPL